MPRGVTTDTPVVHTPRSSRTRGTPTQVSTLTADEDRQSVTFLTTSITEIYLWRSDANRTLHIAMQFRLYLIPLNRDFGI